MFKKSFILVTIIGSSILFAKQLDIVRESTILYKLKEDITASELRSFNALVNRNTIIEEKEIKGLQVKVVKFKDIKGLEVAFSKQLMNTGAVKFAEPDAMIPHAATPNDIDYSLQWHHNTINSPLAWDQTTGSDGLDTVHVCVLDTGVDTDHPDLIGNLVLPGYNAQLEVSGNVEDAHGHGTGTAGVVGAVGNNNIGVAGMAWDMNIIPVQINISDTESSAYISTMARGITWCADQGAKVANLSYGGAQYSTIDDAAKYLRDSGGLLVMAAGNSGEYHDSLAFPDYASFVIAGATDQSDIKTSWSEYGPYIDVTAPGLSIRTTYLNGGYISYSGTSFSSPMTAGLIALIYTVNPNFTPAEVESYVFNTAVDLGAAGDDDLYGHGRINAGAAVVAAMESFGTPNVPPVAVALSNVLTGVAPLEVIFNGSGSTDEDGTINAYLWDFGDGNTGSGVTATHIYQTDGNFNVTLTVTDDKGAQDTAGPIVIQVDPDPSIINAPSSLTGTVDGSNVTLNWSDNSENEAGFEVFRAEKIRGKYNYDLNTPLTLTTSNTVAYLDTSVAIGDYKYKIRAKSISGVYSEFSNEISVKVDTSLPVEPEPDPGTLSAPVLSTSVSGLDVTLTWVHDCPEGSICTYLIERGDAKVRAAINFSEIASESTLSYVVTESAGTYYYRVIAETENGDISDPSSTITVRLK